MRLINQAESKRSRTTMILPLVFNAKLRTRVGYRNDFFFSSITVNDDMSSSENNLIIQVEINVLMG